jgi:hypothetical protein
MATLKCYLNEKKVSIISWRSVLLVEEIGVPGEKHRPLQVTDKLDHIMLYGVHRVRVAKYELSYHRENDLNDNNKFSKLVYGNT